MAILGWAQSEGLDYKVERTPDGRMNTRTEGGLTYISKAKRWPSLEWAQSRVLDYITESTPD